MTLTYLSLHIALTTAGVKPLECNKSAALSDTLDTKHGS